MSLCRFAAEDELGRAKVQPECLLTVLQILTQEAVDLSIRQAASIFFKNLVKAHWAPEDETAFTIPDGTKSQVKEGLLSLFLCVPAKLQVQLSEAMSLIAAHDFPDRWPSLLGQLVGQLNTAASATPRDYARVAGLLKIAHSITGRYRHEFKSDKLYAEIKTVLEAFQVPLLELAKLAVSELPAATAAGKAAVLPLLETLTIVAQLFYDLIAQDLPEYFEDHLAEWLTTFTTLLKYANASLDCDDDDTEPSPISRLQAEVVDSLALLMSKEDEAFQPYLSDCLSTVWTLLMATGLAPHQDLLVTTSIRFLTTVATSPHHALFASPDVLQNVCEKIIAPNVQMLTQVGRALLAPPRPPLDLPSTSPRPRLHCPSPRLTACADVHILFRTRNSSRITRLSTSAATSRARTRTRAGASRATSCARSAATTSRSSPRSSPDTSARSSPSRLARRRCGRSARSAALAQQPSPAALACSPRHRPWLPLGEPYQDVDAHVPCAPG